MHPGVHPGGTTGRELGMNFFCSKTIFLDVLDHGESEYAEKKISKNLQNQRGDPSQMRRVPPLVFGQKKFFQFFFTEIFFFMVGTSGIDPLVIPENFSPLAQTVWKVIKIPPNHAKLAFRPPGNTRPPNNHKFQSLSFLPVRHYPIRHANTN